MILHETEVEVSEARYYLGFGIRQAGTEYLLLKFTIYMPLENLLNVAELLFSSVGWGQ